MKTRSMSKAERLSLDRISTLPQPMIETILCLLDSTKEAARTSILSREWRYKWTTIPKLQVFHCELCGDVCEKISDIANRKKNIGPRCKQSYDINQILLQRQGPIYEVTLDLPNEHCSELDKIILHLSWNHPIKNLTLIGWDSDEYLYELPKSIFSFHHVTHLDLRYIDLKHLPLSNGFGSLVSLFLRYIGISKKALLHLLSNCPSLKNLSLFVENIHDDCTVNELFECLPAIEHLTTWPLVLEWVVLDTVPKELPVSLIHVRYLDFQDVPCLDNHLLAFLLVLIKCSPNLEKIRIKKNSLSYSVDHYVVLWEEYSDVWLEHLNELEFKFFVNTKLEMEFVKFILARSPKLKRVSIVGLNQELEMLKTLLAAPRVSPVVITVTVLHHSCFKESEVASKILVTVD